MSAPHRSLAGSRVLISGAARGIGALLARRLSERGARVALLGLEPAMLERTAAACGAVSFVECDVSDREAVGRAVGELVGQLGGLDVAVANAGIGAQMPLLGGDAAVWDETIAVNLTGSYNLVRAAGEHVAHPGGYFLLTASLAAALHLPLMSAYCASKAGVEALGGSLRSELRPSGARVGVAYYAELDYRHDRPRLSHRGRGACRSVATAAWGWRGWGRRRAREAPRQPPAPRPRSATRSGRRPRTRRACRAAAQRPAVARDGSR